MNRKILNKEILFLCEVISQLSMNGYISDKWIVTNGILNLTRINQVLAKIFEILALVKNVN
jgi:hypothetical protein